MKALELASAQRVFDHLFVLLIFIHRIENYILKKLESVDAEFHHVH